MPAEQEARTKLPHGIIAVPSVVPKSRDHSTPFSASGSSVPDTNDKNPNLVRASHPAGDSRPLNFSRCVVVSRPRHSIQRQAAEYRARFAGRQLGANLLEL